MYMCINTYIACILYVYNSLSLYIYIYTHTYLYTSLSLYIYIYIYMYVDIHIILAAILIISYTHLCATCVIHMSIHRHMPSAARRGALRRPLWRLLR